MTSTSGRVRQGRGVVPMATGTGRLNEERAKVLLRAGWAAKGVVYVLIGVIALNIAAGGGGQADQQGAVAAMAAQPFGRVLLLLLALGLVLYALERFAEAAGLFGPDADDAGGRVGAAASGLLYAAVAVTALVAGVGGGSGATTSTGGQPSGLTAGVMQSSAGRWLVAVAGLVAAGAGLYYAWKGVAGTYREELRTGRLPAGARRWVERVSVVGLVARGVVFVLIGWFLVRAAVQYDPSEAVGLDGALHRLAGQRWGPWLLGATAVGLLAYAVYCFVNARYRDVS